MRGWSLAAVVAAGTLAAGAALAQGNVVAERRAGFRDMESQMEAIAAIVQTRGDQRQIGPRVDQMIRFYQLLTERVPATSLTPPLPLGGGEGQTRALAAIDANRAEFAARATAMIASLDAMKAAASSSAVTGDTLRNVGGTCIACHRQYRGR